MLSMYHSLIDAHLRVRKGHQWSKSECYPMSAKIPEPPRGPSQPRNPTIQASSAPHQTFLHNTGMDLFGDNSDSEVEPFGADLVEPAPILKSRIIETTFNGLLSSPIKLHEDLAKGCGGQIWPAGETLAKYLLRRYGRGNNGLRGKRIVELGAGGGLVGLAITAGCDIFGSELYITDMEAMMEMMARNVALNGFEDRVKVQLLDWSGPIPEPISQTPVDIILAADCVYFEPAFPLLEKTLIDLIGEETVVFFSFKKRRRADLTFMKSIRKKLNVREARNDPEYAKDDIDHATYSRENLYLYIMTRKK